MALFRCGESADKIKFIGTIHTTSTVTAVAVDVDAHQASYMTASGTATATTTSGFSISRASNGVVSVTSPVDGILTVIDQSTETSYNVSANTPQNLGSGSSYSVYLK